MRTVVVFLTLTVVVSVCEAQWIPVGLAGRGIRDIAIGDNLIFAVTNDSGSVYRSTNRGASWEVVFPREVFHVAVSPTTGTVFVIRQDAPYRDTVYRSTDNGRFWLASRPPTGFGVPSHGLANIEVSPSGTIYCCIRLRLVEIWADFFLGSTDDGESWGSIQLTGGRITSFHLQSIVTLGTSSGYTTVCHWGVSTDNGTTWTSPSPVPRFYPTALLWGNADIFLGGTYYVDPQGVITGLFVSTDTCSTWTQISTIAPTYLLSLQHGGFLAGTDSDGVFLFSNNGDSLGTCNQGLTNLQVNILALDPTGYVYAGTGSGVWRRPISEIVTSVRLSSGDFPNKFILEQNYPNPFNPVTTIRYAIPVGTYGPASTAGGRTFLRVYDILGREVATLVNGVEEPGYKSVQWNASEVASGVYFYRLQAGEFVHTKKLTLIR